MLFKAYPEAAEIQDNNGDLTLHIALIYNIALKDVITMLIQAYSKAVEVQDDEGMLPLHYALHYKASDDEESSKSVLH
jgi:hypothetical protein